MFSPFMQCYLRQLNFVYLKKSRKETNVAETSLTIPGIKYVVDTGKEKVKNYNSSSTVDKQFKDSHKESHDLNEGDIKVVENLEKLGRKKLKENESPVEFCNANGLHPKTMEEMSKLRKQLLQLVFNQSGVSGGENDLSWTFGSREDVEHVWRVSHMLPCLRSLLESIAAPPATVLRPEAAGQARVGNLLAKLRIKKIDSCAMLRKVWKENLSELKTEILDWFQESLSRKYFETLWLQMHTEVLLEPEERFPKTSRRVKVKK
ncbi:hypothetical protein ACFX14_033957 [Malus domestica]